MILRDHDGNIIFSACRFVYDYEDVLESEILAIQEGLSLALQWSSLPIDVESDCLEAVQMVKVLVVGRVEPWFGSAQLLMKSYVLPREIVIPFD